MALVARVILMKMQLNLQNSRKMMIKALILKIFALFATDNSCFMMKKI